MDIWHRLGRIIRISNLGTLIFFFLNITLFCIMIFPYGLTPVNISIVFTAYVCTVIISLSPIGEWVLAAFAGAKEIKRKDIKIRLIPLLEIVFERAKEKTPNMVNSLHLKIVHDSVPNAFAIGRKTICVTDGLLSLTDEEIMAVFAHEMGHLAYKHSAIQLLIGGGNIFISGFLLIIKLVCWLITTILAAFAIGTRSLGSGIFVAIVGGLSSALIWLWTKFCMLFLMWSMRQNEYIADEYAFKLGFGETLASVLDHHMCSAPDNGLLKALYATHPHSDDRIARLQELGSEYSRY
nr:MAG TPA: hypothetical protein [Caudoviricetes sp.]